MLYCALKLCVLLFPQNSTEENKELIKELDPDDNGYVDWIQWVTQLLAVGVHVTNQKTTAYTYELLLVIQQEYILIYS